MAARTRWRFGFGQTIDEHVAEEASAAAAGRLSEYREAHDAAHGLASSRSRGTSNEKTRERSSSGPTSEHSAHDAYGRVRSFDFADPEEVGELLVMADAGTIAFTPAVLPPLPADASSAMRAVAEFAAKLIGLRENVMGAGAVMLAVRFVGQHVGLPKSTVSRLLRELVEAGVLTDCGMREPMPGRANGTRLFAAGSVVADGCDDGREVDGHAEVVPVEDVPVDEPVGVDGLAALVVDVPALADEVEVAAWAEPFGELDKALVLCDAHEAAGYEPPQTSAVDELVRRAVDRATVGRRNAMGFWLGCQLRDHRVPPDVAAAAMREFAALVPQVGHAYSVREALASLRSAYEHGAPRDPWMRSSVAVAQHY
jgi:DNA-binding transcriptional ArsR family regulator